VSLAREAELEALVDVLRTENAQLIDRLAYYESRPTLPAPRPDDAAEVERVAWAGLPGEAAGDGP
jgi:hypothetical protein